MIGAESATWATLVWGTGLWVLAFGAAASDGWSIAIVLAGMTGIVGSVIPGAIGRIAAALAVGLAAYALIRDPTLSTTLLALVVVGCVLAGRCAATALDGLRLMTEANATRLDRTSSLLDARAAVELTRARRHGRPLTVVHLSGGSDLLHGAHRGSAVTMATQLAERLRLTDAVGVTSESKVIVLLPETSSDMMPGLMERLHDALEHPSGGFRAGWASFPEDALTWDALAQAAATRALPTKRREPVALAPPVRTIAEHELAE